MKKAVLVLVVIVSVFSSLLLNVAEAAKKPLLMENKQSLFQRMLAIPSATLYVQAGGEVAGKPTPFTVYYIYARQQVSGKEWLQVGSDSHGTLKGWMLATDLIMWNQGLTVAFRKPGNTDRVLLFRDKESLKSLVNEPTTDNYQQTYQAAVKGELPENSPVVAIQPESHMDILKDFYLVPIRDHEDVFLGSEPATMLQVSTIPLGGSAPSEMSADPQVGNTGEQSAPKPDFKAGVVFVIDTTRSMGRYIDRTRKAVREIYQKMAEANQGNSVSFGLVTFRDYPNDTEGLGYLAETVATLKDGSSAEG
ncbi:MAG: VWA domain-containing protein, partial [Methylococcales bacterium]|nr:VWA domain-containing protein [Methylococcales bacterium]